MQLPDAIANQIKAGEVVLCPASVVKELMENAIDAGANKVIVNIAQGGKELIQVIDNGCGMSDNDALKAFDRHATSKIKQVDDIYNLHTFGFRGEALASIGAVAEVELITRQQEDELGVSVVMNGGKSEGKTQVNASVGTQFLVKNLFYNVPARRKFLKPDHKEFARIVAEFQRVALCNHLVEFQLYNNDSLIYNLPVANLRQRILAIMGKRVTEKLLDIDVQTTVAKINGFVGHIQSSKKSNNEQFLFVNGRFFKSAHLHSALMKAYDNLIPAGTSPSYFIYFQVDPSRLDVNVHPQKTEVKFEDEVVIWQILNAAVRESLAKLGALPMMDFNGEEDFEVPLYVADKQVKEPSSYVNSDFNPFEQYADSDGTSGEKISYAGVAKKSQNHAFEKNSGFDVTTWEDREMEFESERGWDNEIVIEEENDHTQQSLELDVDTLCKSYIRVTQNLALTMLDGLLTLVDIKRARERIMYEMFLERITSDIIITQKVLFPQHIELSTDDYTLLRSIKMELKLMGIDIEENENNFVTLSAIPSDMDSAKTVEMLENVLADLRDGEVITSLSQSQRVALAMSKESGGGGDKAMTDSQIDQIITQITQLETKSFTADGKKIMSVITENELINRLK